MRRLRTLEVHRKTLRFAWLALLLLAPGLATANDDADLFYYQRDGDQVPVTPVPWSFGSYSDRGTSDELADILAAAGFPDVATGQLSSYGWWFFQLRDASDPPPVQGAATLLGQFLDLDRRQRFFFTPEFRTPTYRYRYFAPGVIAKFEEWVSGPRMDELLAAAGASVVDIEPLGNDIYRFKTRHRSALDVLDSANALFHLPGVVYAYPAGPDFGGITSAPDDGSGDPPAGIPVLSPAYLVLLGLFLAWAAMKTLR